MRDPARISVIIIFLNGEKFIQEAIGSVLAQTYEHWELLLVDDGSTDSSTEIAQHYTAQHPAKIRYLEHPDHENQGMSATRNLGIHHAQGEFIAFLDADDVWLPEKLAHQVNLMEAHPDAGMVYGNTLYWHSWTGRAEDQQQDHMPNLGVAPGKLYPPPGLLELYLKGKAAVPCTCSLMVRRAALQQLGGFEESFRGMYEDQAFYAKICLAEPILVSDACLDRYRQHPDSNCHVTENSGKLQAVRLNFLNWLAEYLGRHSIKDLYLWRALRQEMWLIQPSAGASISNRWLKKWILRLESLSLPTSVSLWIWTKKR
jgi:glycosyltransferase involved in cell wall biosynthesis